MRHAGKRRARNEGRGAWEETDQLERMRNTGTKLKYEILTTLEKVGSTRKLKKIRSGLWEGGKGDLINPKKH